MTDYRSSNNEADIGNLSRDPVGARLRVARKHFRESQEEFAGKCGVSRSYLSAIERGETKANIDLIVGLAKLYPALSIRWLLLGEGPMIVVANHGGPSSIDTQLFREIGAAIENYGGEIGLAQAADRYWFAAMVYGRVASVSDQAPDRAGIDEALRLLNLILLDEEAARFLRMKEDPSQMKKEGVPAALNAHLQEARAQLGEHFGEYAGRPFWPGSALEADFINRKI